MDERALIVLVSVFGTLWLGTLIHYRRLVDKYKWNSSVVMLIRAIEDMLSEEEIAALEMKYHPTQMMADAHEHPHKAYDGISEGLSKIGFEVMNDEGRIRRK